MIREVDLVSMLPPFLAEYRELRAALEAENPEFVLVWRAADRVLRNEFIATAPVPVVHGPSLHMEEAFAEAVPDLRGWGISGIHAGGKRLPDHDLYSDGRL